jgi:hypothetical protein
MIRLLCSGLDADGRRLAEAAAADPRFELVGGVEPGGDVAGALAQARPDVVLVGGGSSPAAALEELALALAAGAAAVSTRAELAYPWGTPGADRLHEQALAAGRAVLVTGSSPGFAMDLLPAVLSLPCSRIDTVDVHRRVSVGDDPATAAAAGIGLTADELAARDDGTAEAGLECAARLLACAVGVADGAAAAVATEADYDAAGRATAVRRLVTIADGGPVVMLTLELSSEPDCDHDRIDIAGDPAMRFEVDGGLDRAGAAVAVALNAVASVGAAPPGLQTVLDVPPICPPELEVVA